MAKSMARIENGIVVNIEWCSDNVAETNVLIDVTGRPVNIGNIYTDGKFYNNNIEILTEKEILYKKIAEYEQELAILDAALLEVQYQNLI